MDNGDWQEITVIWMKSHCHWVGHAGHDRTPVWASANGMQPLLLPIWFSLFLWWWNAGHSLLRPGGVSRTPGIDSLSTGNTVSQFLIDWFSLHQKRVEVLDVFSWLLETSLKATSAGTFKHWNEHLAKAICQSSWPCSVRIFTYCRWG